MKEFFFKEILKAIFMNSKIYIIGAGGHSRPILEVLNEKYQKINKEIYDLNFKKNKKKKFLE